MSPERPTLSICIPTRNRARHLEASLDRLFDKPCLPFPFEVHVSDNASSDETPTLVERYAARGLPLRYHRMAHDVGAQANILSGLRRAVGTFAVSLADDDALIYDQVGEVIDWMHANPQCVATYGPIDYYDAIRQTSDHLSYTISAPVVVSPEERCSAAALIARHQIIPEVPIFRTAILGNALLPSRNYFIYFQLLDRLLDLGSIRFLTRPHYRILLRQWEGDDLRSTVSKHADFELWESMYRGAHHFHHAALVDGGNKISAEARRTLDRDFETFANSLRNSAIYTLTMAGRFADAIDAVKWLAGCGALNREPDILKQLAAQSTAATFFAVAAILDSSAELRRILLFRFGSVAEALVHSFRFLRPEIDVHAIDQPEEIGDRDSALVLTADDGARDMLIAAGGFPGKIINLAHLARSFDVAPWLALAARMDHDKAD